MFRLFNRRVDERSALLAKPLSLGVNTCEQIMSCSTISVDRRGCHQPNALLSGDTIESACPFAVVSCMTCPGRSYSLSRTNVYARVICSYQYERA